MNIYQELKARGFCYQQTDEEAIEKLLTTEQVKFYVGFDPTGNSLHVGHLLPVMAMRLMQKAGHIPIVLVGGATAQIGDPSGRISARPMMTLETIEENVRCLRNQLKRFIDDGDGKAHFVNNADWLCKIGYIEMLREVGSIFSVNRMLAQESVKSRLENGLSFLEFNYSILQGYDFYILNRDFGCKLEMGGQDQWGNMVAGTELVRRKSGNEVQCMTIPLLMNSNGQKFGKTSGGTNVWLDVNRTSVFDYYQFWRNSDDAQVEKLMLYFSPLPIDEIKRICDPAGNINRAKEILAYEATCLAHGEAAAREAFVTAGTRFGFADPEKKVATTSSILTVDTANVQAELPTAEIDGAVFDDPAGVTVAKLLVLAGLCKSNSDGRRLIQGGAVSIDDEKVADPVAAVTRDSFKAGSLTLRAGKKNFRRVILK
ncbi:tyrosine--tRNA ligase [Victivallis vadensis]|uniref:Tyrosine--tRNA ligase n=1 Tax=Victivallis vadensis TaxID=172901 RepID=A0A2U1B244_9BACT|nr:tyrosine--tRNA ligase [Victivallis vadensis]NMD86864.1 tyrosine--tRNA ligase [Victivallis vadensis]PVY42739.1 tyrosyl-tRNA synthetase [Victivallis vadensis]HJH03424.1 tyrosine--tRNA ligase [Victivallis vadensis]